MEYLVGVVVYVVLVTALMRTFQCVRGWDEQIRAMSQPSGNEWDSHEQP